MQFFNRFYCHTRRVPGIKFFYASLIFAFLATTGAYAQPSPAELLTSVDGRTVSIAMKAPGAPARFYSFKSSQGVFVRFFTILDAAGTPHVAFDACDVCFQARKGYRVLQGYAICNNCGSRFPLLAIGRDNLSGGCWPSYLPIKAIPGSIVIAVADLQKKQFLFQ